MDTHKPGTSTSTVIITVVVVVIILGGAYALLKKPYSSTSSGNTPTPTVSSSGTTTSGTQNLTISNFAFSQPSITVHVGDTVTWTNQDSTAHTVTSTDGGPLNSGNMANGVSYSYTFTKTGTYAYHCSYHPYMTGIVTVQ